MQATKKSQFMPEIRVIADRLLKSDEVRARLGYESESAFWKFVKASGLPCVRLNARVIRFPEGQLNDFLNARSNTR